MNEIKIIDKIIGSRFLNFIKVGAVNTLFGFLLFSSLSFSTLDTWLILLLSQVGGVIFNFYTFGNYVFYLKELNRLPKFILFNFLVYLLYLVSLTFLEEFFNSRIIAISVAIVPISLFSYLILSKIVFKKYE